MEKPVLFWFRRDLRLEDNTGLQKALDLGIPVLPLFIFDSSITDELDPDDARISFIYRLLKAIHHQACPVLIRKGDPVSLIPEVCREFQIAAVYCNRDYEPYAVARDREVEAKLATMGIPFQSYKDQVLLEKAEVVKSDGSPYTVYTPFKNAWLKALSASQELLAKPKAVIKTEWFIKTPEPFPQLAELGFEASTIPVRAWSIEGLDQYHQRRDYPAQDGGSYLGPHLRFGAVSIRNVIREALQLNETFLQELIWREFFMQILWHFPQVVSNNFRRKYDGIRWINKPEDFDRWCQGQTGYPIVDAGMRELKETGYMHNRVRMVTASFLSKHLLIDWRWGEAWFAKHLLDYELASNNGNWQWAAGTGCDAAPYFRVFNPWEQQRKFDPDARYIRKWVPEWSSKSYPEPMVDHAFARNRAIEIYRKGLQQ